MTVIENQEFGGERPLFAEHHLRLDNVTFHAGESVLKCCSDIRAERCRFEGKYPFWHTVGFNVADSVFTPGARAAIWYSKQCVMKDTRVEAPKMFREVEGLTLENVEIPDAQETLWHCKDVHINGVRVNSGAMYGDPTCIRINMACPRARLADGLDRICTALSTTK